MDSDTDSNGSDGYVVLDCDEEKIDSTDQPEVAEEMTDEVQDVYFDCSCCTALDSPKQEDNTRVENTPEKILNCHFSQFGCTFQETQSELENHLKNDSHKAVLTETIKEIVDSTLSACNITEFLLKHKNEEKERTKNYYDKRNEEFSEVMSLGLESLTKATEKLKVKIGLFKEFYEFPCKSETDKWSEESLNRLKASPITQETFSNMKKEFAERNDLGNEFKELSIQLIGIAQKRKEEVDNKENKGDVMQFKSGGQLYKCNKNLLSCPLCNVFGNKKMVLLYPNPSGNELGTHKCRKFVEILKRSVEY